MCFREAVIPLLGEFIELFYLLFVSGRPCRGKVSTSCAPGKKERRAEPLWRGVLLKKQNVFARAGKSRKEGLFLPKDAARQLAELRRRTGNWRLSEIRSFRRHDEGSCRNIIGQQTSSAAICASCRTTERCGGVLCGFSSSAVSTCVFFRQGSGNPQQETS